MITTEEMNQIGEKMIEQLPDNTVAKLRENLEYTDEQALAMKEIPSLGVAHQVIELGTATVLQNALGGEYTASAEHWNSLPFAARLAMSCILDKILGDIEDAAE